MSHVGVRFVWPLPAVDPETGCWRWQGRIDKAGYGRVGRRLIHRVVYELLNGPVESGIHIDHVYARGCRYHDCFNPAHLEAVTAQENRIRSAELITHCPAGHPYEGYNLILTDGDPQWPGTHRYCRECMNRHQREYQARKKEKTQ